MNALARPRSRALAAIAALTAAAAMLAAFGPTSAAQANGPDFGNASCHHAIIGSGPSNWRQTSISAGPVALPKRPLRQMARGYPPGLVTKMMVLVNGHSPVTLIVPERLRKRVFLLYGRVPDRNGRPSTSFANARGLHRITFNPCGTKPRTVWPGGIRVIGRKPVKLRVQVGGEGSVGTLRLGKPRLLRL